MFVKWAIIKLLITMHVAMPADIFTKAVDLMTNIPWVYRILSDREAAGRKPRHQIRNQCSRPHTKMRNVMMNISWSNTAKLTRLVEALNEYSCAWREVMNKEGDGSGSSRYVMSKRPAATTIGRTSPRQTRREYRVSAPPGG